MARLVIADTGPINYLVLIGCVHFLPVLFGKVILPDAVLRELSTVDAPREIQTWTASLPDWLEVLECPPIVLEHLPKDLHEGELAAITLATALKADLVLMDDRKGVAFARSRGLRVTGTLGILDLAAQERLTDFSLATERLRQTNFRAPEKLLDALLERHTKRS